MDRRCGPGYAAAEVLPEAAVVPSQRPVLPAAAAVEGYLERSRAARRYSNFGPCCRLLAERLQALNGCVPVASGTLGLLVAVASLRERSGREAATQALMPSFAFPATAQAAVWNGLRPVFVDVDADHWRLDPETLDRALAERCADVAVVIALSAFGTPPPAAVRARAGESGACGRGACRCSWTRPRASEPRRATAGRWGRRATPRSCRSTRPSRWRPARAGPSSAPTRT